MNTSSSPANGNALAAKLAAVHAYDLRGWRMTPARPRGKEPYMVGWTTGIGVEEMTEILSGRPTENIGIPLGKVSDGLICIDLDNPIAAELADQYLPPTGLVVGRKRNPKTHWFYRVVGGIKATKFKLPADPNDKEKKLTVVEVLGDGNQVIVGPSVHPSGDVYDTLEGEPATVGAAELLEAVESLFNAVLDRLGMIRETKPKANSNSRSHHSLSPGKDFDDRGDVRELLERHGWSLIGGSGNDERWRRPGKDHGISASLKDGRLFYCFTSSAPGIEGGRAYGPFGLFAALECGGNFHQAHEQLQTLGFGEGGGGGDTTPQNSEKIEVVSPSPVSPPENFRPFPVEVLPQLVGDIVRRVSKAMGCDASFVAVPALAVLAGAIGNSRRIRLKNGWTEPAIVWSGIIGESGTLKSPPLEWLTQPLRDREETALERHAAATEDFEGEQMRHDAAVAEWKKKKSSEPPPRSLVMPTAERRLTSDATIESVCLLLADNPRGMILVRDELAGWVSAFDQYKSHGGSDAAHWLSIHSAKGFAVDRKTGDRRTLFVPRPAMSVTGGIQPATLRSVLAVGHIESGLAARLLFSYPPRQAKRWTEAEISPDTETTYKALIDGLFALEPHIEDGKAKPLILGLSPAAKSEWITFYNEHAAEQADLSGDLASAWSKLECYTARLALVVHCVRVVTCDPTLTSPDLIDESSIGAGVSLSRWFGHEARRVYAMLAETEGDREQRQLMEWITTRGGAATARELQRGPRRFRNATPDFAEAELNKLVKAGWGVWEPIETTSAGGTPSRRFRMREGGDWRHNPQKPAENRGCVAEHVEAVA